MNKAIYSALIFLFWSVECFSSEESAIFEVQGVRFQFTNSPEREHDFNSNTILVMGRQIPAEKKDLIITGSYAILYTKNGPEEGRKIPFRTLVKSANYENGWLKFHLKEELIKGDSINCLILAVNDGPDTTKQAIVTFSRIVGNCPSLTSVARKNRNSRGVPSQRPFDCDTYMESPYSPPQELLYSANSDCFNCDSVFTKDNKIYYYDYKCRSYFKYVETAEKGEIERKPVTLARERLRNRDQIRFRIVNVNTYRQQITVKGSDITDTTAVPDLFNELFIGNRAGLYGGLLNKLASSIGATIRTSQNDDSVTPEAINDLVNCFQQALKDFNDYYFYLEERKLAAFNTCFSFPCCDERQFFSYGELAFRLQRVRTLLGKVQESMREDESMLASQAALSRYLKEQQECVLLDDAVATIEAKIAAIRASVKPGDALTAAQKAEVEKFEKQIADAKDQAKACIPDARKIRLQQIELERSRLMFTKGIYDLQEALPTDSQLQTLYTFVNNIRQNNMVYTTTPISVRGNRLELKFTFTPTNEKFTEDASLPLQISVPVAGKPVICFSSGVFVGMNMRNKTYAWQPVLNNVNQVTDTSSYVLAETGYTYPPVGFAALLHAQWKTRRAFGFGPSIGVGLTIESDPRVSYMAGGSLFFGDQNQVAISGGLTGVRTNRITNNLQAVADQKIVYTNSLKPGIDTYPEFRIGAFLSASYVIFGNKRSAIFE